MGKNLREDRKNLNKLFAVQLRKIRMGKGLTQEKFSEFLDVSISAYKKLESGENRVSMASLKKFSNRLNVPADILLYGEPEGLESVWEEIENSPEEMKMRLLMELMYQSEEMHKLALFYLQEKNIK